MKLITKIIILSYFLVSVTTNGYSGTPKDSTEISITYVANEGFLIESGDKKVLIDALFGHKELYFCDTPHEKVIRSVIGSENIFSETDLVLASHNHIDHFYSQYVAKYLSLNNKSKFISCKQTINDLAQDSNYVEIKSQIVEITPDSLNYVDTLINDIELRVYRLTHGPYYVTDSVSGNKINKHRHVQNLGFLFSINGVKVFHCGDSSPGCIEDYKNFRLDNEDIDIAFLGPGFVSSSDPDNLKIVTHLIKPKHIVLMHIHPDNTSKYTEIAETIKKTIPDITVFRNQLEVKSYNLKMR